MCPHCFLSKIPRTAACLCGRTATDNCIQTNGTLLTPEWCQFLKNHGFLVGVSIDGPQKLHDKYRRTTTNKHTFSKVMKSIDMLCHCSSTNFVSSEIWSDASAPSRRKTIGEYGYTTSATKSTNLHHAAIYHHSEHRMNLKKQIPKLVVSGLLWALTDSNRRPSACKADALNQLS